MAGRKPTLAANMKQRVLLLFAFATLSLSLRSLSAAEEKPLSVYSGDGLSVAVFFEDEESGEIGGEVRQNGSVSPFTGLWTDEVHLEGNLIVKGKMQPFAATAKGRGVTFVTAGKTYHLKEGAGVRAIDRSMDKSLNIAPTAPPPVADLGTMKLKRVAIRDVTMGGVVAHTMLIPTDWKLEGHIEWSTDGSATWQNNFKVSGPHHEQIAAIPTMVFNYAESQDGRMNPIGTPPPRDLGKWVVALIKQKKHAVSEVTLLGDKRDPDAEAAQIAEQLALGVSTPGMITEAHIITLGYLQDGVRMRQEIHSKITRMPPIVNRNIRAQTWLFFTSLILAAPDANFDQLRPQLLAIAGTRRMVPKWWNQMMQVRGEMMRVKAKNINAEIARRGKMYDQISNDQLAAWKRSDAHDSEIQRQRIQGIQEVQDYRDRDGSAVELPFHHKYVFSDGEGNYVLTNDYNTKPGGSFEEIQAAD